MENTQSNAEKTLSIVANIVLWMGIVSSIILFIVAIIYLDDYDTRDYGVMLLIAIIPSVLSTLIIWALLKVFCNISLNLKEINSKTIIDASKCKFETVVSSPQPIPATKQKKKEESLTKQTIDNSDNIDCNIDDDSLENVVLGHILSDEISTARHLLITKKGMTLNQAIEYIDKLKTK